MRRLVIPLVALVALGASACGGWRQDDAASVNGVDIESARLEADTRALLDQPGVAGVFLGVGAVPTAAAGDSGEGAPEGRLPTAALSSLLNRQVIEVLAEAELAARGQDVTEADVAEAEQVIRDELAASQQASAGAANPAGPAADPVAEFEALPEGLRGRLVRQNAVVARLRQELAAGQLGDFPEDAEAWYRANQGEFEEYCLSVVPVADEAEGQRLAASSASGQVPLADLVTLQNGQEAGCGLGYQLREQLLPDLAEALVAAPVGRAVGPFPASDGTQILVGVSSRTPRAYPDVTEEAAQLYQADRIGRENGPWEEWLNAQEPDVTVDPRYGTWDGEDKTIRPPEGTQAPAEEATP